MKVRYNLAANLLGSAWTGAATLVFVPVYLRHIGAEGYGLVGFYGTIAMLSTVFDAGFGGAAMRELARAGTRSDGDTAALRNLVRTLEWLFWGIAVLLGAALAALAPLFAMHWLNLDKLPLHEATSAIRLMGAALMMQWPIAYYTSCLNGLQRQVALNTLNGVMITMRFGGAAAVLALYGGGVESFFVWQAAAALAHNVALHWLLWYRVPAGVPARFEFGAAFAVRRFALGVGGVNVLGLLLIQLDKMVLSAVLPLEQFGYYSIGAALTSMLTRVVTSIFNATYPKLTQFVLAGDRAAEAKLFMTACQLMAIAVVPLALMIAFFGSEVIRLWTGDAQIAGALRTTVALLAAGTMMNAFMTIPYALQLAHGWTRLAATQNVIAIVLLTPLTIVLASTLGLAGAGTAWALLNLGYVLISARLMFRRLLPELRWPWYRDALLAPVLAASMALVLVRLLFLSDNNTQRLHLLLSLVLVGAAAQLAAALATPTVRAMLRARLGRALARAEAA